MIRHRDGRANKTTEGLLQRGGPAVISCLRCHTESKAILLSNPKPEQNDLVAQSINQSMNLAMNPLNQSINHSMNSCMHDATLPALTCKGVLKRIARVTPPCPRRPLTPCSLPSLAPVASSPPSVDCCHSSHSPASTCCRTRSVVGSNHHHCWVFVSQEIAIVVLVL